MALKIEIGKIYKNKSGYLFQVVAETPETPPAINQTNKLYNRKYIGVYFGGSYNEVVQIAENGYVYRNGNSTENWYLSEEYKEPEYSYINVFDNKPLGLPTTERFKSFEDAKYLNGRHDHKYLHTLKLDPTSGKTTVFTHDLGDTP